MYKKELEHRNKSESFPNFQGLTHLSNIFIFIFYFFIEFIFNVGSENKNKQTKNKTKASICVKREISCTSKQGFKFTFVNLLW